jgi:histidyl-tRNA synthetase
VEYPLKELAFGKQFKAAAESGARLALIYGGDELARGVVKMRDMGTRTEREFPASEVEASVRGFFAGP